MKPPAPHTRAFVTTRQASTATIRTRPRENDDVAPRGVPQIDSTFPPSRYCADGAAPSPGPVHRGQVSRSEEHTSELQSRLHLVCRLLLEKKKKKPRPPSESRRS